MSQASSCETMRPVRSSVVYSVVPVYGLNLKVRPPCLIVPSSLQSSLIVWGPTMRHRIKSACAVSGEKMLATAAAYFSVPAKLIPSLQFEKHNSLCAHACLLVVLNHSMNEYDDEQNRGGSLVSCTCFAAVSLTKLTAQGQNKDEQ